MYINRNKYKKFIATINPTHEISKLYVWHLGLYEWPRAPHEVRGHGESHDFLEHELVAHGGIRWVDLETVFVGMDETQLKY